MFTVPVDILRDWRKKKEEDEEKNTRKRIGEEDEKRKEEIKKKKSFAPMSLLVGGVFSTDKFYFCFGN